MIGEGLNDESRGLVHQSIEAFMPNFAPEKDSNGKYIIPTQIQHFVVNVVDHVNAQTVKEATAVRTGSHSVDFFDEMTNLGKKFLKDYLDKSQWNYLDKVIDSFLSNQSVAVQRVVKQIWVEIKPDIEHYINADIPPANNTMTQLFSIIKEFAGGYIAESGWKAIENFVMPNYSQENITQTLTASSQLTATAKKRTWDQAKRLIEGFLGIKSSVVSATSTEGAKTTKPSGVYCSK